MNRGSDEYQGDVDEWEDSDSEANYIPPPRRGTPQSNGRQFENPQRAPSYGQNQNSVSDRQPRAQSQQNGTVSKPVSATASSYTKPKKKNAYVMFVYHRRKQYEDETGEKLTVPLPQLMKKFDADWKHLPDGERERWRMRAKSETTAVDKTQMRGPRPQHSSSFVPNPFFKPQKTQKKYQDEWGEEDEESEEKESNSQTPKEKGTRKPPNMNEGQWLRLQKSMQNIE